ADALLVAVEAVRFEEVAPEGVVDGVEVVLVGELGAGDLLGGVGVRHGSSVSPRLHGCQASPCTNFLCRAAGVAGPLHPLPRQQRQLCSSWSERSKHTSTSSV